VLAVAENGNFFLFFSKKGEKFHKKMSSRQCSDQVVLDTVTAISSVPAKASGPTIALYSISDMEQETKQNYSFLAFCLRAAGFQTQKKQLECFLSHRQSLRMDHPQAWTPTIQKEKWLALYHTTSRKRKRKELPFVKKRKKVKTSCFPYKTRRWNWLLVDEEPSLEVVTASLPFCFDWYRDFTALEEKQVIALEEKQVIALEEKQVIALPSSSSSSEIPNLSCPTTFPRSLSTFFSSLCRKPSSFVSIPNNNFQVFTLKDIQKKTLQIDMTLLLNLLRFHSSNQQKLSFWVRIQLLGNDTFLSAWLSFDPLNQTLQIQLDQRLPAIVFDWVHSLLEK
jgi:hypothetical protein